MINENLRISIPKQYNILIKLRLQQLPDTVLLRVILLNKELNIFLTLLLIIAKHLDHCLDIGLN